MAVLVCNALMADPLQRHEAVETLWARAPDDICERHLLRRRQTACLLAPFGGDAVDADERARRRLLLRGAEAIPIAPERGVERLRREVRRETEAPAYATADTIGNTADSVDLESRAATCVTVGRLADGIVTAEVRPLVRGLRAR